MTPQEFARRHEQEWQQFEALLNSKKKVANTDFPRLYRQVCAHLALARSRQYPVGLIDRLNEMALGGQQRLYQHQGGLWTACLLYISHGFPTLIRQHARLFWISTLLFYGPLLAIGIAVWREPTLIYSVMPADQVAKFHSMYESGHQHIGYAGEDGSRVMMFGFYVKNNTGIGFQTFAGGVFAGVGSLFYVVYNGISIGAVGGYLIRQGLAENFLSFVVTHSAFELTAIVISGMAGFMLGLALIAPGQRSRRDALVYRGQHAVKLVYGAAGMFFIAAAFEGFWSASTLIPTNAKFAVGGIMWMLVISYFLLAGRGSSREA